jgi:hypothetical protein
MAKRRYTAEEVVTVLRQMEVALAKRQAHAAVVPGGGDHRANLLSVAQGIRRAEAREEQAVQGTREREQAA